MSTRYSDGCRSQGGSTVRRNWRVHLSRSGRLHHIRGSCGITGGVAVRSDESRHSATDHDQSQRMLRRNSRLRNRPKWPNLPRLGSSMKILTAKDAKYSFGRLIDLARAAPVTVAKHGRPVVVVMSIEEYDQLRALEVQANSSLPVPRTTKPQRNRAAR
jgi:prevent-host-death family protein